MDPDEDEYGDEIIREDSNFDVEQHDQEDLDELHNQLQNMEHDGGHRQIEDEDDFEQEDLDMQQMHDDDLDDIDPELLEAA